MFLFWKEFTNLTPTDTKTANAPVVFRSAVISYFVLRDHNPLHCEYEEEEASG